MSNNLGGPRIATAQTANQHTTSNDADNVLDAAQTEPMDIDVGESTSYNLDEADFVAAVQFELVAGSSPSPPGTVTINLPDGLKRGLTFWINSMDVDVNFNGYAQSAPVPTIPAGGAGLIAYDGDDARLAAATSFLASDIANDSDVTGATVADALNVLLASVFTAASTTEALTGTDSAKGVTPDALAALWEKGSDVASAGTLSLGEGGYFHVTGTTTITDIDWTTAKDGRWAWLIFDGILTLTHHATTLKLPGGANITTAAGDRALFVQDASDNVICLSYVRADGTPLVNANIGKQTIWIPASAMTPATTSGPATGQVETSSNKVNFPVLDFDATADESAHFNIAFPKGWNEGTVTFQVWWTTSATDTDGVAWGLEAVALSDNEASDTAFGTSIVVTDDAQSAALEILITAESSAVTIAGSPAAGDICFFKLIRDVSDANDDMSEDARLIGIKLFYTTDAATDV